MLLSYFWMLGHMGEAEFRSVCGLRHCLYNNFLFLVCITIPDFGKTREVPTVLAETLLDIVTICMDSSNDVSKYCSFSILSSCMWQVRVGQKFGKIKRKLL